MNEFLSTMKRRQNRYGTHIGNPKVDSWKAFLHLKIAPITKKDIVRTANSKKIFKAKIQYQPKNIIRSIHKERSRY